MTKNGKLTTYLSVAMVTIGFLLMFLGWNFAAEVDSPEQQFPYLLSATVPGLGLVLAGLTLALVQELRRLVARVLERLEAVETAEPATSAMSAMSAGAMAAVPADGSHVLATSVTYHSPDCHVVEGRTDLVAMSVADAQGRDLRPCRICLGSEADAETSAA